MLKVTGAFLFFAIARISARARVGISPRTTGIFSLMIPAFSFAINSRVSPRN